VTEGEQGKYGRDGALWERFAEGDHNKGAAATGPRENHSLPLAMYPAAKAESE
jgi:hypothetical protein